MMESNKGHILVIDDKSSVLKSLSHLLEDEGFLVTSLKIPDPLLDHLKTGMFDVILLDMNFKPGQFSGNEGLYWLNRIMEIDNNSVVILITAFGDIELAIKGIKQGAMDFILKPWDNEKLIATIFGGIKLRKSRIEICKLKGKQQLLSEDLERSHSCVIGRSKSMQNLFNSIKKVSATDANILILGENGTGKEIIAREIHRESNRKDEIFMPVDLGSVSEGLFESEMFGYTAGAFTDAKTDKQGRMEAADRGTLFLDEVTNLNLHLQSKLLQVLQNRQIIRLGSTNVTNIDIRLISASNKSINKLIQNGLFREDLYYRINTVEILLPPLRERDLDIIILAEYFLKDYSAKYDKPGLRINEKAKNKLMNYTWPGNVRELRHLIENAVIMADKKILGPEEFSLKGILSRNVISSRRPTFSEIEKQSIHDALEHNNGSVIKAAKELGLSRQTLYNKIIKYNLEFKT